MPDLDSSTGPTPSGADTQDTQLEPTPAAPAVDAGAAPETPADPSDAGGEDANAADSSVAEGVKKDPPLDLASVVRAAAKKEDPKAPKSPDGADSQDAATVTKTDAEKAAAKEAGEDVPFAKHPRWQEVLKERKDLRKENEALKPDAEEWSKVVTFMNVNQLTPEETAQGFQIMALIKHDPAKALQALAPYIEQMEMLVGKKLPADLQKQVDDGAVTAEVAQETARLRVSNQSLQATNEQQQQSQQRQAAEQRAQAINGAVTQWEQGKAAQDPDYKLKQPVIKARLITALATKRPATAEEALKICNEAYALASEDLKPILAKRAPTPKNPGSSSSSTRAAPVPSSLLEVVKIAAAGGQR